MLNSVGVMVFLPDHIVELGSKNNILYGSVMEETGGLGVDIIVDCGGMCAISHSSNCHVDCQNLESQLA